LNFNEINNDVRIDPKYSLLSSLKSHKSSVELAELSSPGVGGAEPLLKKCPDDELMAESTELAPCVVDGTRRYLQSLMN
jgi:hypothetical protein